MEDVHSFRFINKGSPDKTISDKCGQSKWSKIAQDVKVREVHVKEMQCCERVVFQCEPEKVVWSTTAGDGFLL